MKKTGREAAQAMFETRSQSWRDAGLIQQVDLHAVRRARTRGLLFLVGFVAVIVLWNHWHDWFDIHPTPGLQTLAQIVTVVALLLLGWAFAAELGRALGPSFFRRMDPSTAGTVGFIVRLVALFVVAFVALYEAGVNPRTLTITASFAAVIFGLAAQQTLGNVIAGMVLLSARPFTVGDRVRLQAGVVGGQLEGIVSSLGLLYTTFASGEDMTMVPNSVVLNSAVIPLRNPDGVDLVARLPVEVTPRQLQHVLEESIRTPVREAPRIRLEAIEGDEVLVRISATPLVASDGPALATEVLEVVASQTRPGEPVPPPSSAPAAR